MSYLVGLGVPAARLGTPSCGQEKPACTEPIEACWVRNRRALQEPPRPLPWLRLG